MDNCDSHGRSSSTGSELKRVYEYSSRFCSAVVIYFQDFPCMHAVCAGHIGAAGGHVQGVCRTVLLAGRMVYGNQCGGNPAQGPV